jgi:hypothetical protein
MHVHQHCVYVLKQSDRYITVYSQKYVLGVDYTSML